MALHVRTGGAWKEVQALHVRSGGVWKPVTALHVRSGGVWKPVTLAGGGGGVGGGPSGAPVSLERFFYSGTRIALTITLGDPTAQTRVYRRVSGTWSLIQTLPPGETTSSTGYTSGLFGASHYKNGQESSITTEA